MADPSASDVKEYYGTTALTDSEIDSLIANASTMVDDIYGGRLVGFPEVEGTEKEYKALFTCHLIALREGGESQSESQTGGSITYNVSTAEATNELGDTKWGRMFSGYLRDEQSFNVHKV